MQFGNHFRVGITVTALLLGMAVASIPAETVADGVQPQQQIFAESTLPVVHADGDDFGQGRGRQSLDVWLVQGFAYNWVDISVTGQATGLSGNDSISGPIPMGISFRWFGTTQTAIRISTNGYLTFNSTANTGVNTAIPNVAEPNGVFYAFWDDLMVDEAQGDWIKYFTDTTANPDRFIVTWQCRRFGGTAPVIFQAILNADGRVIYQYQALDIRNFCTVGMESPDGTYGYQMCYDGTGTMPSANAAYRFYEPSGMPNPVTNLVAATLGTNVALTWTNSTTDVYGAAITVDSCDIYRGTTFLARVGANVTSFGYANTQLGSIGFTVYAWNNNILSLPTSVTANVVSEPVYNYQEDFELSNGGWTPTPATGGWEWGVPTFASGPTAHSGSKLWGTVLAGNYTNNACYQLELAATQPVASTDAALAFWGWYKSEGGNTTTYDGCNLQISTNGGAVWQIFTPIIGVYDDTLMTVNNTCIGQRKPTWNGNRVADSLVAGRWRYFLLPLSNYIGQTPVFRFTFGSDNQAANYPGFYLDDLVIWGLQTGGGATVSGTVLLDGGAGVLTQAVVRADGFSGQQTNPSSLGAYTLPNVQLGQRFLYATLTGYQQATLSVAVNGDLSNVNLTLRRAAPVAPTGLTADVSQTTGIVTLDWADSPDPYVDLYRVYRKRATETTYTLNRVVYGRTSSAAADTLTEAMSFHYVVTAVDTNVIAPAIESAYSERIEVLYGALPPQSLHARADFDDHVRLSWVGPTDPPMMELSHDNGVNSPQISGIGFSTQPTFGWIAARFQTTGAVTVHRIRVYLTGNALLGDAFQVGLFADNGSGRPTFTPLDVINATIELPLNSFREFYLATPRTFTNGIFYVGVRQIGDWRVSIGGDAQTPFVNNTFFFAADPWAWTTFEPNVMAIPMMRAVVQGTALQAAALSPTGWEYSELQPDIQREASAELTYLAELSEEDIVQFIASRLSYTTGPRAPYAEAVSPDQRGRSTFDDPDYYIVYRNGVDVAHPTGLSYDDYVSEGTPNTYWLTSHFANGLESSHSDTVTAMPAMAPAAPVVTGTTLMNEMQIRWGIPTRNRDNSLCNDLTSFRVYRGDSLLSTLASTDTQYVDTPPYLNRIYTWSVRAVDEASNASAAGVLTGSVLPPYEDALFDWVDISTSGTTAITGDDATSGSISMGFLFPFYGKYYSQVRICTNGWLSFLSTASVLNANVSLPATSEPNAAIYPFWDNLNVVAASGQWVKYQADPQRFVVTWRCQYGTNTTVFEFQTILDANGTITIQYMSLPGTLNSYTLGVENATGTSALQLFYNGSGVWSPFIGTAIQIFAPPPVFAPASGTVAFDGGSGTMTGVTVSASGPNLPSVQPAINGSWSMDSVATGYRRFIARHTGYVSDTVYAVVPTSGVTNLSFTLRRNNPPAPTGFSASISTASQIVTMNWAASPDLLVDAYRIYRKPASTSTWSFVKTIIGRTSTTARDTLVDLLGGYNFAVTAIDTNVTGSPVESDRSTAATVIAGHPVPSTLAANGLFDDRIRLTWAVPGAIAAVAVSGDTEADRLDPADAAPFSKAAGVTKDVNNSALNIAESRERGNTLDEVINYRIYRDGALLATVAGTVLQYNDTPMPENQPHSYYITAIYDDNQESASSNVVSNIRCNLAPGAPTGLTLTPWGTNMRLSWVNPTVNANNADGATTPCTDLAKIYIYRNNALIDSVAPSITQYTDTPPVPTQAYTWSLKAVDEVPNVSAAASQVGIVQSPWQPAAYNWIDISTTGTTITFSTTDDANSGPFNIGFNFPYYGQNYTTIRVCTNGWLTFSTSTSTNRVNALIPNTADPNAALYILWDDLVVTSGWVKYLSEPANGRFVITWNFNRYNTSDPYTQMQIILTSNGAVKYQYQGVPPLLSSCTVGLENAAGTEGVQLVAEGTTSVWTPTAQSAVEFWGGPSGSVEGTITTYTTGAPIPDCVIWATGADHNSDTVVTDASGHYAIRTEPGAYTMHFDHPNFCLATVDVLLADNIPYTQNMQLRTPNAQFSVSSLTFVVPQGRVDSATFTIRNLPSAQCALNYVISDTSDWLTINPTSGILNANQTATIRVYADAGSFPIGTELNSTMIITYHGTGSPRTMRVDVAVVPPISASDPVAELPTEYALHQSYPNPFNPTTQLQFDVPKESLVDIAIYNVMGQEVAHPVSTIYQPGRYNVTFDASGLPSGMYIARMQASGFSAVNKMMLLR